MMKRESGFTLIELLIVILVMGFVLAAGSDMFINVLRGFKQQSKIAETSIEGIIGLEMLRSDVQSAGYGLPWKIPSVTTYQEATNATAALYNDSPSAAPRALVAVDGGGGAGKDYLIVKSLPLATNTACKKWNYLFSTAITGATNSWSTGSENLNPSDRVIVINPGTANTDRMVLKAPFGGQFGVNGTGVSGFASDDNMIVYGVDQNTLRMPFNRADYYVSYPPSVTLPQRCARGTGVLVKSLVRQSDGAFETLPLLDCVADMQIVTNLDLDENGTPETPANGYIASGPTAAQDVRNRLKEVRIFILSHEGNLDRSYMHSASTIRVGQQLVPGGTIYGDDFDLTTAGIPNWQNYRWKLYTLVIKPNIQR